MVRRQSIVGLTIELLSSDDEKMTYGCLTLHFIDDGWEQKKILAFRNLSGNYNAETKVNGGLSNESAALVKDYNLYGEEEPWEIFNKFGGYKSRDNTLYCFTTISKKTPNSAKKMNRTVGTNGGTWHGDGSDEIKFRLSGRKIIGTKKRFRFQNYRQPDQHGCWIMLQYGAESISESIVISQLKRSEYGNSKQESRKRNSMDSEVIIELASDDEIVHTIQSCVNTDALINSELTPSPANHEPHQIIQNQDMWPVVGTVSIEEDEGDSSSTEGSFYNIQNIMGFETPEIIKIKPALQVEPKQVNFVQEHQQPALATSENSVPAVSAMAVMDADMIEYFKNEDNWFDNLQALLMEDCSQDDLIDLGRL
ncbi:unnamed protein product [Dovyalis caffra]|uniref:NAC domain-containing protein n=1 Tax=Dovyalis caffra TaxID=77055 RepID=A0AAV1RWJ7_9ROSI|nr:unnamed protein product [Dovyalis caffra]